MILLLTPTTYGATVWQVVGDVMATSVMQGGQASPGEGRVQCKQLRYAPMESNLIKLTTWDAPPRVVIPT